MTKYRPGGDCTHTETAEPFMVGNLTVALDVGACDASAPLRALGACQVTVDPTTVLVEETFTMTGVDVAPKGDDTGLAPYDSGQSTAVFQFDDDRGGYNLAAVAKGYMIGEASISMSGVAFVRRREEAISLLGQTPRP